MKILGIIWKVVENIITIAIVLGVFSIASNKFETVVLAILVIIYISITTYFALLGLQQITFAEVLDKQFKDIKKLIKNPKRYLEKEELDKMQNILELDQDYFSLPQEIDEYEKEAQKERAEMKNKIIIKFYISACFQFVIYIFALYKLISGFN